MGREEKAAEPELLFKALETRGFGLKGRETFWKRENFK